MLFLYRLEDDDEGDPRDDGVVRATDLAEAMKAVEVHLGDMLDTDKYKARFYDLQDTGGPGVLASESFKDVTLQVTSYEDV